MTRLFKFTLATMVIAGLTAANAQTQKPPKFDSLVVLSTEFGEITMMLYDDTPLHRANFLKLAGEGYYNGTTFHRVIDGFMIQGGDPNSKDQDPNNDGMGGPGYLINAEILPHRKHEQGALAAARTNNPEKKSSGSQFYIVENKEGAAFLNNQYTVFGKVLKGIEVVEKIAEQPKDGRDRPNKDIKMTAKVMKVKRKKVIKTYGPVYQIP